MIEFEWDADKAATNLRDHGISFEHAAIAYRDPFAVEWIDISARRATRHEQDDYYLQNAP